MQIKLNIRKILLALVFIIFCLNIYSYASALNLPVNCAGLAWCDAQSISDPANWEVKEDKLFAFAWTFISEWIKIVAVVAVVALMLAWLNLVVGWWLSWEEEKVSQAKKWVLWAMVWVILSVSAWFIINIINELKIDNL